MTQREKIKIFPNAPLVVTLENCNGRECNSAYTGLEYRYDVERQGRPSTLYLPPEGMNALRRAQPQPGDEIELLKTSQGVWEVRVLSDAQPFPPQYAEYQQPQPQSQTRGVRLLAPRPPAQPQPQSPSQPQPAQPAAQVHPLLELMTRCLEVGYYANQTAYRNLTSQGVEIDAPTWEDVRATGISFFIEKNRNGAGAR